MEDIIHSETLSRDVALTRKGILDLIERFRTGEEALGDNDRIVMSADQADGGLIIGEALNANIGENLFFFALREENYDAAVLFLIEQNIEVGRGNLAANWEDAREDGALDDDNPLVALPRIARV